MGSGILFSPGSVYKVLALAAITVWAAVLILPDDKLHVVFCDVGQGDAILVYRKTTQMLVDGGPDNKILGCLARHVPFYDRRIEMAIVTHPQADHMNGIMDVIERYNVMQLVMGPEGNNTVGFKELTRLIADNKLQATNVYSGDEIKMGGIKFNVVWPERSWVLGANTEKTDLNEFGISGRLTYGNFDLMLTADVDQGVEADEIATGLLRQVEVLKVPHHGSKTGMTEEWLRIISPELAVISVGKNNYGHPTKEALDLLGSNGARVLRTDTDGEVEVVSDGKRWWVVK